MPAMRSILRVFSLTLLALPSLAHAQDRHSFLHDGSLSVGGTGQFTTTLATEPSAAGFTGPTGNSLYAYGQQQYTTLSAGFVSSLQLHPVSWAGLQLNYGFTHYQERYTYSYSGQGPTNNYTAVPTDWHEATAGYLVHPKHIPLQPYLVLGGGAILFNPVGNAMNVPNTTYGYRQWRGAGLLELGFDMPVKWQHVGFRISGRSLYYRAPNFGSSIISTQTWRVTAEPEVSTFWRF